MLGFILILILTTFAQKIAGQSLEKFVFVREIDRLSNIKSYVCILENNGEQFVLKQTKGSADRTIIKCVLEVVGTHIAQSINIPCNSAEIIKPTDPHHKLFKDRPATLHSFAKGKTIARCKEFKLVRIKQQFSHTPEEQRGLTLDIIQCMHVHPLFPRLCAVDTFIGNRDRHRGNLFYDEETKTFTAIDFNNSGIINLASIAQKNIEILISKKTVLQPMVIEGLKIYQDTIKELIKLYTPEKLIKNLDQYLKIAIPKNINKKVSTELDIFHKGYQKFVRETHSSSQKLITSIDKLLEIQQKMA